MRLRLIALLCIFFPSVVFAEIPTKIPPIIVGKHEIGTHGYFRMGTGMDIDGKKKECFKAPGAGAKYRLGNECDHYGEVGVYEKYRPNGKAGPYIHTQGVVSFGNPDNRFIKYTGIEQLFIEIGEFGGVLGDVKFWLGKRDYDSHDIHINDFTYLSNKGKGGGVKDFDLGFAKFSYAFINSADATVWYTPTHREKIYQNNHDFRISEINTNPDGQLMLWFNYAHAQHIRSWNVDYPSTRGIAIGAIHKQENFYGTTNTFAVQYGNGLMRNLKNNGLPDTPVLAHKVNKANIYRILNTNLVECDRDWAVMSAVVIEETRSQRYDGTKLSWWSVGARPIYYLNDNLRLAFEAGHDRVYDRAKHLKGGLTKLTLATELAPDRGFMTRPVVRAYITHAMWPGKFKGQIGGEAYKDKRAGTTIGLQFEAIW
jgi:maltoporin